MTLLSDRIKQAMQETKPLMRAVDLARSINVTRATMSDIMSGKTREMKGSNLVKAAKALNVTPEWLATGVQPMRPNNYTRPSNSGPINQIADSASPLNIQNQGIPAEAFLKIIQIIETGIGNERFNSWTEEKRKQIVNRLQTITLDKESKDLSIEFILKMVDIK